MFNSKRAVILAFCTRTKEYEVDIINMEVLRFKSKDNVEVEDQEEWRRIIEEEVERMGKTL
jgi:hypothetical protein